MFHGVLAAPAACVCKTIFTRSSGAHSVLAMQPLVPPSSRFFKNSNGPSEGFATLGGGVMVLHDDGAPATASRKSKKIQETVGFG